MIEALGATTVLCTDKTGTLSTGGIVVSDVVAEPGDVPALWAAALRTSHGTTDPLDLAVVDAAAAAGVVPSSERILVDLPFDADTRSASRITLTPDGPMLSVKGAPEVVLARCPPEQAEPLRAAVDRLASSGGRVIAVARAATDDVDAALQPLGLIVFEDPLRPSTRKAVARCRRAGIRFVLVTGDHPRTAKAIAEAAGLDTASVVRGDELWDLEPAARDAALRSADVVARVDPATKVALVEAHQRAGEVVAMVGDGVNDAPALHRAAIGVAIAGESGTDVAREAADIVVVDDDLDTIVETVVAGRTVDRNLGNVVAYLLGGNLSEVAVVVVAALTLPELVPPLLPVQLLWVNLLTDGLPAAALGVDRAEGGALLRGHRSSEELLSRRRLRILGGRAATLAVPVLAADWVANRAGWAADVVRAELLLALVCGHLLLAYSTRAERWAFERGWWRSRAVAAAVGGSLVLQVPMFTLAPARSVLDIGALPPAGWLVAACAAAASVWLMAMVARVTTRW